MKRVDLQKALDSLGPLLPQKTLYSEAHDTLFNLGTLIMRSKSREMLSTTVLWALAPNSNACITSLLLHAQLVTYLVHSLVLPR